MQGPLVSVITPLYNGEKTIARTIQCVQEQTYRNWEMLIADDASQDASAQIVQSFAMQDPRIRCLPMSTNRGAAAARNHAMAVARGKYLAFLDSDDEWLPNKLKRQIAYMEKYHKAMTYTDYCVIDGDGTVVAPLILGEAYIDYRRLLMGSPIMCASVVINREAMGPFTMPESLETGEDYATWASLLRDGKRKAYNIAPGTVYARYRESGSGISANKCKTFRNTWRVNRKYEKLPLPRAVWYMARYCLRWVKKHYFT